MKTLINIIKNTDTKTWIGLGVAAAIGTATGVKKVTDKHKKELARTKSSQRVSEFFDKAAEKGSAVVTSVKEDISTVVDSVKAETENKAECASGCPHCERVTVADPCCKNPANCKFDAAAEDETETSSEESTPEPVKAEDVVSQHEEADTTVETQKNDKLAEKPKEAEVALEADASEVVKEDEVPTPREVRAARTRAPRASKTNVKPAKPAPVEETDSESSDKE